MTLFLDERRYAILKALVESYLSDATPVASKKLLDDYHFLVSAATMRNEMAFLEQLGLIESPHTSAGRIPTDQGMRLFVDQLMDNMPVDKLSALKAQKRLEEIANSDAERIVKDAVMNLSKMSDAVGFATMPWKGEYSCFGLSNLLKHGRFEDTIVTTTIMEKLEDRDGFVKMIESLSLNDEIHILIGEENVVAEFQSCSMLVTEYILKDGRRGVLGILGPKCMNYSYNVAALDALRNELQH